MSKTKRILLWTFWPALTAIMIFLYTKRPQKSDNDHLAYIPSSTKLALVINARDVFDRYLKEVRENPLMFKDFENPTVFGDMKGFSMPIDPISKISVFQFDLDETKGLGIILRIVNFPQFLELLKITESEPLDYKKADIYLGVESNTAVVKLENTAVVLRLSNEKISLELVKDLVDDILSVEDNLITNNEFNNELSKNDQFFAWSEDNLISKNDLNAQLHGVLGMFEQKIVHTNLVSEGFVMDAKLALTSESDIVEREVKNLELRGTECLRLGVSLNPKKFNASFEQIIPKDKLYLLNGWNGGLSAAIDGFEKVKIQKVTEVVNGVLPTDSLYPFAVKTEEIIDLSMLSIVGGLMYPKFNVAFELGNVAETKLKISKDSSISDVEGIYSFILPEYLVTQVKSSGLFSTTEITRVQRVYFYFVDNSIVFCPHIPKENFVPEYTTFGVNLNFDAVLESYDDNSILIQDALSEVSGLQMESVILNYKGKSEGKLLVEGAFTLKDTDNHLREFPRFFQRLSESTYAQMLIALVTTSI